MTPGDDIEARAIGFWLGFVMSAVIVGIGFAMVLEAALLSTPTP